MRIAYIAYPTSLSLASANAIQTWTTLRELRRLEPDTLAIIPRWLREPSRFSELGALHVPRPAIGKLSRLHRSTLWYYAERSAFACMSALVVAAQTSRPVDVVYVREVICAGWWTAVFGPMLGIPVIFEVHDLESWNPSRAKEAWVQPVLHLLDKVVLRHAAAVTSLTEDFRQLLARMQWRQPSEVAVIPDAFDQEMYAPGDRLAARSALGLDLTMPLFVYSGMTFSYRGLERLIEAFVPVREQFPTSQLVFVGGRPKEIDALQLEVQRFNLAAAVRFIGQRPQAETPAWLHAADVLVIPDTVTDVTASPLKLFEYLAVGQAVVLPDIPALMEVLPPAVGYYFKRADTHDLAHTLLHAYTDPQRSERAAAGLQAVQPHTYAARAQRIHDLAHMVLTGDQVKD